MKVFIHAKITDATNADINDRVEQAKARLSDLGFEDVSVRLSTDQSQIEESVFEIQNAIYQVTGMRLHQYANKCRKTCHFFARMLFVHHCREKGLTYEQIALYVNQNQLRHCRRKYMDEVTFNNKFAVIAEKVNQILNT